MIGFRKIFTTSLLVVLVLDLLGGVRLAAAEANLNGGLNGYKVVVRGLDDESTDDVAVGNVQTIQDAIDKGEKVLGVIGHLNSGQTIATMELYNKIPLVG